MMDIDRSRYPLGSNHAGQISAVCPGCHTTLDVGYERLKSLGWRIPLCHQCHGEGA